MMWKSENISKIRKYYQASSKHLPEVKNVKKKTENITKHLPQAKHEHETTIWSKRKQNMFVKLLIPLELDGCRPGWLDAVAFDGIDGPSNFTDPAVPPATESGFGWSNIFQMFSTKR